MNRNLTALANKSLPAAFRNAELTYNAGKNIFLTQGYTSMAGNTYYQGVRFSDRIIITQQIGQGYCYTFLNGIKIFGYNGKEATLIAQRFFNCCVYNEDYIKRESENMIKEFLRGQAELSNSRINEKTLDTFSKNLVDETMKHQLPCLNK